MTKSSTRDGRPWVKGVVYPARMRNKTAFLTCLIVLASSAYSAFAQSVTSPEAAPGLRIPNGDRPWALDEFGGSKELVPMHPSAVGLNNHKGSNLAGGLAAGPFFKPKMTTEVEGPSAHTALHTGIPVFYVRIQEDPDAGSSQSMVAGWAVVHVSVEKDHRLLSTVKFTQLTGNAKRSDGQVDTAVEKLTNGWLKIVPTSTLPSGEYALLPVMRQQNAFSTSVYDFRIDPSADNAKNAVTPTQ